MKPQLTIEAFANWCEKQPADKKYNWVSLDHCACAQYAEFLGSQGHGGHFWPAAQEAASYRPWTFGALASRLRAQA